MEGHHQPPCIPAKPDSTSALQLQVLLTLTLQQASIWSVIQGQRPLA